MAAGFAKTWSGKVWAIWFACLLVMLQAGPARAALADLPGEFLGSVSQLTLLTAVVAITVFFWALVVVRRLSRDQDLLRSRLAETEARLNEAEAILTAEPSVLIVWRGRDGDPAQVAGDMRGTVNLPADHARLLKFSAWLGAESAETLETQLAMLRSTGTPFNIGIRTSEGELLEADGRTAGGLATLRFRPLAGERRQNTELAYDTRKMGKQVERLSAILDSAPFPVWLDNKDRHLVWVNRAYLAALESNRLDDVLSRNLRLFADADTKPVDPPDPSGAGPHAISHAVIGGNKHQFEIYERGIADGFVGFAIDTSALDDTRKELKRHIRAHGSTLDNLATAIAIFGADQRLRYYNAAYADLWDLDQAWLDTHPRDGEVLDKLRENRKLPEQANYRDWKRGFLSGYTTLEPRENWWHLPDGRTLRVVTEQHPFGGVTYLFENVTEQILLESRYNELIGVQRETLDNLYEGVALVGSDGSLRLYNPSFARFWRLDEAFLAEEPHIDQIIARCRDVFDDERFWGGLQLGVTGLSDDRRTAQERITRPDGKVFDIATVPLPDGNTLITYLDVTDSAGIERALRERNDALEAADRLKTNFLSNVSYELRTPLTNILGFAEGLTMGIVGPLSDKQSEYVSHIQASSNDLMAIIDAILDLTTIDAGAMELRLGKIDVPALLEETARSMADWIERRDQTLNVEIAEDAVEFVGDVKRVRQVLTNLLSNAIGFSGHGATVRMGARLDKTDVLLWVADTGRGIEPEFQKKAFDRFQSRPVAGGHRGPGLGLAIVKSFVELHGGKVSLLSQLSRGTTVICRFPLAGPPSRKEQPRPQASRPLPAPVQATGL